MPLEDQVECLSASLHDLGTGPLAELRRMDLDGPGTAGFWFLAARCGFPERQTQTEAWMGIVKVMAILTPRGERGGRHPLHDATRPLGAVFCDGGNPAWPLGRDEPRPFLSETRLARFLSQRPGRRSETLLRTARMLAAERDPASGVDCAGIARLLLYPDDESALRSLARTYYQRLDTATRKARQKDTAA